MIKNPITVPANLELSNFSKPIKLNFLYSYFISFIFLGITTLVFLPKKYIVIGIVTNKEHVTAIFILENTVFENPIKRGTLLFTISGAKSFKCPTSEILTKEDPEIPPCQIIKPEYPAAPINP